PREDFDGNSSDHLVRSLPRQTLHRGIEYLVSEFGVVNDDAFRRSLDDLVGELIGLAQGLFAHLLGGNVTRKSEYPLGLAVCIQNWADHDVPPTALARNPGCKETGETSDVSVHRSFDCRARGLAICPLPKIEPGRIQHRREIANLERLHASFIHKLKTP